MSFDIHDTIELIGTCSKADDPGSDLRSQYMPSGEIDYGPCYGFRDRPRLIQFDNQIGSTSTGFLFQGLLQFFWINTYSDRDNTPNTTEGRTHSCINLYWDSLGHLREIDLDDYKGTLSTRTIFWERDNVGDTQPPSSALADSDGCPRFPPSSFDPSDAVGCSGVIVRAFALWGTYDQASSDILPSSVNHCMDVVKVFHRHEELVECGKDQISDVDSTLGETASELALQFDSAGHLRKIFFGGLRQCDDNPCVWDRENPPDGTAGVAVPIIQFVSDKSNHDFRLWFIYFDSLGHYKWSCQYALLCGCDVTGSSSEEVPPGCPIFDLCVLTPSGCIRQTSQCFGTIDVDAFYAHISDLCRPELGTAICTYVWSGQCCNPTPCHGVRDSANECISSFVDTGPDPSSSPTDGCWYIGSEASCGGGP